MNQLEQICGVYAIYDATGKCIYVGSSKNIAVRLSAHKYKTLIGHVECFPCSEDELLNNEEEYIAKLKPSLNKNRARGRNKAHLIPVKRTPRAGTRLLVDLQDIRKKHRVNLKAAAREAGLSGAILLNIEHGCTPRLDSALKIAAFVDIPVEKIWALK